MFPAVKKGDSGPKVKGIQVQLNVCKTPAPPAPFAPVPYPSMVKTTGEFDDDTKKAVEFFQKHVGLKVDGEVGPKTLKMMFKAKKAKKQKAATLAGASKKLNDKQKMNLDAMRGKTANLKALQKLVGQLQKSMDAWTQLSEPTEKQILKCRDDRQLAQLGFDSAMKKQQQYLQLMSSVTKKLQGMADTVVKQVG